MDCERVEREEIIEKYLTGRLDRAEQDEFETHYFSCSKCLQKLQVSRLVQGKLWEKGRSILSGERTRARFGTRRWVLASVGAVAVLIVVGGVLWRKSKTAGARIAGTEEVRLSLSTLARFEPPPYVPATLRRAVDEATERFRAGMKYYAESRYGKAVPELRAAAALGPQRAGIRFFLGICLVLTQKTSEGIEELRATILLGDSAYLEEAHFYLAKAFLGKGDVGRAKKELNWVLERDGDLKEEAAGILAQLR